MKKSELKKVIVEIYDILYELSISDFVPQNPMDIQRNSLLIEAMKEIVYPCKALLLDVICADNTEDFSLENIEFTDKLDEIKEKLEEMKSKLRDLEYEE